MNTAAPPTATAARASSGARLAPLRPPAAGCGRGACRTRWCPPRCLTGPVGRLAPGARCSAARLATARGLQPGARPEPPRLGAPPPAVGAAPLQCAAARCASEPPPPVPPAAARCLRKSPAEASGSAHPLRAPATSGSADEATPMAPGGPLAPSAPAGTPATAPLRTGSGKLPHGRGAPRSGSRGTNPGR